MKELLDYMLWGNKISDYIIAALCILLTWILLKITRRKVLVILKNFTRRSNTIVDDRLIEMTEKYVIPFLFIFINYQIITQLTLSPVVKKILAAGCMCVTTYFAIRLVNSFIKGVVLGYMQQKGEPQERIEHVGSMLLVITFFIWGFGIILLIDNLGYDVTTIIAGLGVGGIAIALAAQNILGDLFSYFVIFFDKPFEIGDFIVVENNSGVVEKIGIKTSHIRSPDGQQLVMPNAEMVKSTIHNFKRLERRRVVFSIGVVYSSAPSKLRLIRGIIEEIVSSQPYATFSRAHLKCFGDFSINYEIVYFIESADYVLYMNAHHDICLKIFEQFGKKDIEFAFPTQTLFINGKDNSNHLAVEPGYVNSPKLHQAVIK